MPKWPDPLNEQESKKRRQGVGEGASSLFPKASSGFHKRELISLRPKGSNRVPHPRVGAVVVRVSGELRTWGGGAQLEGEESCEQGLWEGAGRGRRAVSPAGEALVEHGPPHVRWASSYSGTTGDGEHQCRGAATTRPPLPRRHSSGE